MAEKTKLTTTTARCRQEQSFEMRVGFWDIFGRSRRKGSKIKGVVPCVVDRGLPRYDRK